MKLNVQTCLRICSVKKYTYVFEAAGVNLFVQATYLSCLYVNVL